MTILTSSFLRTTLWSALILGASAWAARGEPSFDLEEVRRLVLPNGEELRWREIPWMTDLLAARKRAALENKPILLWEMDGHPLGCT